MTTVKTLTLPKAEVDALEAKAREMSYQLGKPIDYIDLIRLALVRSYRFDTRTDSVRALNALLPEPVKLS